MVVLDFEDYVQPKDLKAALVESGLWDRVRTLRGKEMRLVARRDADPGKGREPENPRRVVTVSEKHGDVYKWLPPTYSLFQETPYTFSAIKGFSCRPKRGGTDKPMFLINHWLRPNGPPDPTEAANVNSREGCCSTASAPARGPPATPERPRGRLHHDRRPVHDGERAQRGGRHV